MQLSRILQNCWKNTNTPQQSIRVTSATSAGHLLPRGWRSANIPAEILAESPAGRPAISKSWPSWGRSTKRED